MDELLEVTLSAGAASLTLVPRAGGRASSLVVDGMELLAGNDASAVGWGCYPMVPWQGRLTANSVTWAGRSYAMPMTFQQWALHGLSHTRPWEVLDSGPAHAVLAVELGVAPEDPWPWHCEVQAMWRLGPNSLETTLEVHSKGGEFPAELGLHPWFRRSLDRGGDLELDLGPGRMYVRGEDDMLTGQLVSPPSGPYDDAFELTTGRVSLRWPGCLELVCETDCGYAVVYDHLPDVVCVEPQTAPPDWINRFPVVVRPGSPRTANARWIWRRTNAGNAAERESAARC